MAAKKISELTTGSASLTSIVPASDAAGTVTNKVTVQSILNADARWALFLPAAPTSLTTTAGNAQVSLSWTAPTVSAQTPITDYIVQSSTNSGSTWTTVSDGTSTATSATVTGLTNGTPYVFRVAAVNGVGTGPYTAATDSVTPGDVFRAIPTMTSNTAPSGVVSGDTNNGSNPADLWKIFDGDDATYVSFNRNGFNTPLRNVRYAFPELEKSRISGYAIKPGFLGSPNYFNYVAPNDWKFYASDDGETWTLLDTRTAQNLNTGGSGGWMDDSVKSYTLASPANYRMYKLEIGHLDREYDYVWLARVQLLA
jgi:hypothetical protein